jgi:hypothetical protein
MANERWFPLWLDTDSDGARVEYVRCDKVFPNSREARVEAQRLCEKFDGIAFGVKKVSSLASQDG